jgi:hypothetical protein
MALEKRLISPGLYRIGIYGPDGLESIPSGQKTLVSLDIAGTNLASLAVKPILIDDAQNLKVGTVTVVNNLQAPTPTPAPTCTFDKKRGVWLPLGCKQIASS